MSPAQEGHGTLEASPEEGHEAAWNTGAPPLFRQAEKVWSVQPGAEKVVWEPHSTFQNLRGPEGELERDSVFRAVVTDKEYWVPIERGEIWVSY